ALIPAGAAAEEHPAPRPARAYAPRACGGMGLASRIANYVARLPNLGEGQGRDDVAYRLPAWLVRDPARSHHLGPGGLPRRWPRRWDSGNPPPKGDDALRKVIANSHQYGRRAVGSGRALAAQEGGR